VVERVPKSVLAAVFSAIVWLSVEFPIDRIISVGELLLLLGEGDTFTYTLENNSAAYFAIDGNTLKLAKTVDYKTTKRLIVTVRNRC
jgi:hypothetical protein